MVQIFPALLNCLNSWNRN